MRVLGKDKLTSFMRKHAQSHGARRAWLVEAEKAGWQKWADVKQRYPSADLIGTSDSEPTAGHSVVFNIKGNDFRLVVKVYFSQSIVIIDRIGTHAQYNKWKL